MAKKFLERLTDTKTRTLFLFVLVLFIVILFVVISIVKKPSAAETKESKAAKIPEITAIPGNVTSERYQNLQEKANLERAQEAKKAGTSAVATIIGTRDKDALTKKESFGIEDQFLKGECRCVPGPGNETIPTLDPALAAKLISQIEADPASALKLMQQNPGLAKALCTKNPELALKTIENNEEAAKIMLKECPAMAKLLAERNPALFKKIMLENPELAKQLAASNPELFKKLMLEDPEFARALAKSNPDLVKTLMKNDPEFANQMAKKYPDMVKTLMRNDPDFAKTLAKSNPDLVKELMKNDPEFAKAMSQQNPDMVKILADNDPAFAKLMANIRPSTALTDKDRLASLEQARLKQKELETENAKKQQLSELQQKQITALLTAMDGQSKAALQAWNEFTPQQFVAGKWATKKEEEEAAQRSAEGGGPTGAPPGMDQTPPPSSIIIKAGTILFAVLDTSINTDEPGPVLATIVDGKFKGAKVLGSIQMVQMPGGNRPEKVMLNFNSMSIPSQNNSISIKAVAIDPETARTALATNVDHHYLLRYGSMFASSFMTGYAKIIASMGTVQTTAQNGLATTTQSQQLSTSKQLYAALGEVGKNWGQAIKDYINLPNTVTVDAGTGMGLLILSDVTP